MGGWLKSWEEIEGAVGASIAVGSRAARVNCGFLETPAAATWTMRLHEAMRLMRLMRFVPFCAILWCMDA